jgi:cell division protein ZapA
MAQVTIEVNGRPYQVGCEDGQERRLAELARLFDTQVRQVSSDLGQLGETRLFLMAGLLLLDELSELRGQVASLQAEQARLTTDQQRLETRAAIAIERAATRIERLAAE